MSLLPKSWSSLGRALHAKDVLVWAVLVAFGAVLSLVWLDSALAPAALPLAAQFRGEEKAKPLAAVVDISFLYDHFPTAGMEGSIDSSRLKTFLDAVKDLDEDIRPRVIGFDILVAQADPRLRAATGVEQPEILPHHEAFIDALVAFGREQPADERIRFRIGTDTRVTPPIAGLPPEVSGMWASLVSFREIDRVPLHFHYPKGLDLLGLAVLNDYREVSREASDYLPLRFTAVACPSDLPPGNRPHECMFVNYSSLRRAEDLTIRVPGEQNFKSDWSTQKMFGPEAKAKLRRMGGPKIWLVGAANGPNETDFIAIDGEAFVAQRSVVFRGIYQHLAVIDSAANSPIRHTTPVESFVYDLFFSLSGLMVVVFAKRSFEWPHDASPWILMKIPFWLLAAWPVAFAWLPCTLLAKIGDALWKRAPSPARRVALLTRGARVVLVLAPLAATWVLARFFGIYWLGFLTTWVYVFIEPFLGGNVLGHGDVPEVNPSS